MNERLHPLTLGEILDRTAHLYRSRFLVFLGIAVIPAATVFLLAGSLFAASAWVSASTRSADAATSVITAIGSLIAVLVLFVPLALGANALGDAAITDASARLFLGTPITIRGAYQTAWQAKWRYSGLYLLQGLIIIGIPAVVCFFVVMALSIGTIAGGAQGQQSTLIGVLVFLLIIGLAALAVWLLLRYCLAFAACVVEQTSTTNALQRASRLSHGTRGRIFVLYLLGVVLNQVLAMGITIPAIILLSLLPALKGPAHQQLLGIAMILATYGAFFAVKALVKPIYGIALTLFYFDQRIRKEGFDIEWMMGEAGMLDWPAESIALAPTTSISAQPELVQLPADVVSLAPAIAKDSEALPLSDPGLISTPEEGKA